MEDNADSDGDQNAASDSADGGVEEASDEEEQHFDISLAASHSYMGSGLVEVSGRSVLEEGWVGHLPAAAHHGAVFPGETVPMLVSDEHDADMLTQAINQDKLFGLLCPDESGTRVCGYGVVCEVFEVGGAAGAGAGAGAEPGEQAPSALSFKARATHRFRFAKMPKRPYPIHRYTRMRLVEVRVLPELRPAAPLRLARLASLDGRRHGRGARALDAALTPWPRFVYDMFDYARMRRLIEDYFRTINMEKLPEEPVSLSFWVASNLALAARDRLALFAVDDALLRLHMEVRFIAMKSVLCCAACGAELARRDHVLAMSSDGVHSNYTNLGGYVHDIVTVSRAVNIALNGSPSAEYSWFPGYAWSVALCQACMAHVGWRFDAMKRSLRPQRFFGLCRNYVQPRAEPDPEPEPEPEPGALHQHME